MRITAATSRLRMSGDSGRLALVVAVVFPTVVKVGTSPRSRIGTRVKLAHFRRSGRKS